MKFTNLLILPAILMGTLHFISCKKDDIKNNSCRIVTITEESGSGSALVHNITYNNDGKISTLQSSGTSNTNKVFNYTGNTIIVTTSGNNNPPRKDSITLNSQGRPVNIRQYFSGTNFDNYVFEYDGSGELLKNQKLSNGSATPETTIYTNQNGNIVSIKSPFSTVNLEYFNNKSVQQGDYLDILSFISYSVSIYPHKNLVKSIVSGNTITNYDYEFDSEGLITKVTATGSSGGGTLTYQYQCN